MGYRDSLYKYSSIIGRSFTGFLHKYVMKSNYLFQTYARPELCSWIDREIQPDIYAVVHLKRSLEGMPLTREAAEGIATKIMKNLSIAVLGEKGFRHRPKGRRLLPNCITLEMVDDRPHLNLLLRKPERMSTLRFQMQLHEVILACPWYRSDHGAYWCEERDPRKSPVDYVMKEGTEALLARSLSF